MKWSEVATIINQRMSAAERDQIARVDVPNPNGITITEIAVKLVKDTFGIWSFITGGADDDDPDT